MKISKQQLRGLWLGYHVQMGLSENGLKCLIEEYEDIVKELEGEK